MIIVSNTSPINNLAAAGHLSLLEQLYGNIIIPVAVSQELSAVQTPIAVATQVQASPWIQDQCQLSNQDSNQDVATQVQASPWIQVRQVGNFATVATILLRVDRGEAEAIALALELKADLLLIDERKGRTVASSLGISMTGVLGVLIEAKSKGLILADYEAVEESSGFQPFIS